MIKINNIESSIETIEKKISAARLMSVDHISIGGIYAAIKGKLPRLLSFNKKNIWLGSEDKAIESVEIVDENEYEVDVTNIYVNNAENVIVSSKHPIEGVGYFENCENIKLDCNMIKIYLEFIDSYECYIDFCCGGYGVIDFKVFTQGNVEITILVDGEESMTILYDPDIDYDYRVIVYNGKCYLYDNDGEVMGKFVASTQEDRLHSVKEVYDLAHNMSKSDKSHWTAYEAKNTLENLLDTIIDFDVYEDEEKTDSNWSIKDA